MEKQITIDDIKKIQARVDEGRRNKSFDGGCQYVDENGPTCLVGWILDELNLQLPAFGTFDNTREFKVLYQDRAEWYDWNMEDEVVRKLNLVQNYADLSYEWHFAMDRIFGTTEKAAE